MADNRTEYAEFLQRILNGDTSFSLLKQSIPAEKWLHQAKNPSLLVIFPVFR